MANVIAKALWALAANISVNQVPMVDKEVNCSYVQELLNCLTVDQTCDLANAAVG